MPRTLFVLLFLVLSSTGALAADPSAVEIMATWPGEKGPTIKVEAYPVLSRIVDEETEEVTMKLGKRQTYAYLRPDKPRLVMPLEPGDWRLRIGPDETSDTRDFDVTLKSAATEKLAVTFGKIIARPRTVGDAAMPAKVEVYRGKKRIFYGYSKAERKNVVVSLFPGRLRVVVNGDDEPRNALESTIELGTAAPERIAARFGRVVVRSQVPRAKYEFFQSVHGKRVRILYRYAKPGKPVLTLHLRPGAYEVDVTNEDTDRKTTHTLKVTTDREVVFTR